MQISIIIAVKKYDPTTDNICGRFRTAAAGTTHYFHYSIVEPSKQFFNFLQRSAMAELYHKIK